MPQRLRQIAVTVRSGVKSKWQILDVRYVSAADFKYVSNDDDRPWICESCDEQLKQGSPVFRSASTGNLSCLPCCNQLGYPGASTWREYDRLDSMSKRKFAEGNLGAAFALEKQICQWHKGASAERSVAEIFANRLSGTSAWVIHDCRQSNERSANIDHIGVGRGGVTVIDTKNWSGRAEVSGDSTPFGNQSLMYKGEDAADTIRKVQRQVKCVTLALRKLGEAVPEIDVIGCLCWFNQSRKPPRNCQIDGVQLCSPELAAGLVMRVGPLSTRQVEQIARSLYEVLRAA